MYTLSEFMTKVKEDMGIMDIKLPVDDTALVERFANSALKEFSVRYPFIEEVILDASYIISQETKAINGSVTYEIPKRIYEGTEILMVLGINTTKYTTAGDLYMPSIVLNSADMVLQSIGEMQMAAELGRTMTHAPTFRFISPNKVVIYHGWINNTLRVEVGLKHDLSLSTIPTGAFTHLLELATLDLQEFLYNKLKRINSLDVGIGTIELRIDDWQNARQEKRELLREWDNSGNLDLDRIMYW